MEKLHYPGWRSALFLPVHIDKFVAKAHTRGADAYILDLEDSVPLAQKAEARECVVPAARTVKQGGAAALVRINQDHAMAIEDLDASVHDEVSAIVVPKVESPEFLHYLADRLCELEQLRGLPPGHTGIIAMIESVAALPQLDAIAAAHPRVIAMTLGSEDFSATAGMVPNTETLYGPSQMLAFACRRAGIVPLGFPGSIADYSDIDAFREVVRKARDLGFVGAFCIHPKQVAVLNEVLTPSEAELQEARELVACFEQALTEGKGAAEFNGKMIDLPVVDRARELLRQSE
ncbi:MAG: CoA ester lyase [Oleiphilaceae bacterium]|nr:CoA ester lyase [Oleiphilaceae bacterium]